MTSDASLSRFRKPLLYPSELRAHGGGTVEHRWASREPRTRSTTFSSTDWQNSSSAHESSLMMELFGNCPVTPIDKRSLVETALHLHGRRIGCCRRRVAAGLQRIKRKKCCAMKRNHQGYLSKASCDVRGMMGCHGCDRAASAAPTTVRTTPRQAPGVRGRCAERPRRTGCGGSEGTRGLPWSGGSRVCTGPVPRGSPRQGTWGWDVVRATSCPCRPPRRSSPRHRCTRRCPCRCSGPCAAPRTPARPAHPSAPSTPRPCRWRE